MSYILEALKKSQRERELGQVPTLADAPYLSADRPGRGAYWGIVALTLAILATLIALYAAFGERWLSAGDSPPPMPKTTRAAVPGPVATAPAVAATATEQRPKPAQAPDTPAATAAAPPPEKPAKPSPAPVRSARPATAPAVATRPAPTLQLPPGTPDVPADLLQDVRRFEEQLRQQKPIESPRAEAPETAIVPPEEPPTAAAPEPEPAPAEDPQRSVQTPPTPRQAKPIPAGMSELPPAPQSIPEHRLTVHVYSATPEQRFVIINSRKMREGDRSRDDLLVEEITPDGVVLEYQGQRFFRHR